MTWAAPTRRHSKPASQPEDLEQRLSRLEAKLYAAHRLDARKASTGALALQKIS